MSASVSYSGPVIRRWAVCLYEDNLLTNEHEECECREDAVTAAKELAEQHRDKTVLVIEREYHWRADADLTDAWIHFSADPWPTEVAYEDIDEIEGGKA